MKNTLSKIALSLGFIAIATVFNVAQAASLVGYTTDNQLYTFDSADVGGGTFVGISGLVGSESFVGIDLRPSNNTIYGVTTSNNVYTLNASSGAATFVTALSSNVIDSNLGYGFDFNPAADFAGNASLRLVSSAGNNYAVNVNTGVVGNTASMIGTGYSAVAYTLSTPAGAPTDTPVLYYVNADNDTMFENVKGVSFNAPNIVEVGKLNANIGSINGFEIFADGSAFLAAIVGNGNANSGSFLFDADIETGEIKQIGRFGSDIRGLTAAPSAVPVPAAAWLFGSALIGFAGFRRKSV
ncbi:MAG: DUF4394 domain-containing protein [Pseudomonadota bacterium]